MPSVMSRSVFALIILSRGIPATSYKLQATWFGTYYDTDTVYIEKIANRFGHTVKLLSLQHSSLQAAPYVGRACYARVEVKRECSKILVTSFSILFANDSNLHRNTQKQYTFTHWYHAACNVEYLPFNRAI